MTDTAQRAARILWELWRGGTFVDGLPGDCRPADLAAGYAVQAAMTRLSGQRPVGYKIAASSAAGQQHLKITHPVYGRLYDSQMVADGGRAAWIDHPMSMAELEFAFEIAETVPVRAAPYEWPELSDFVAAMHIGIELPGSRFMDPAAAGIAQIVADNACAGYYTKGPRTSAGWRDADLAGHRVKMRVNGVEKTTGVGSDALGDPRLSLAWLVNELSRNGIALAAGQLVTTGVCGQPVPVFRGDEVTGDFGCFGTVRVQMV